jgi:hypothetical protein
MFKKTTDKNLEKNKIPSAIGSEVLRKPNLKHEICNPVCMKIEENELELEVPNFNKPRAELMKIKENELENRLFKKKK